MTKDDIIQILKKEIPYLKEEYGVSKVAVFGSYAKNQQTDLSDVDIFVEFNRPIGLEFFRLCDFLESRIGKKLDVITAAGLKTIPRQDVIDSIKEGMVFVDA